MSQKPFLLAAEGLTKSFDGFKAINDLSIYLDEGELRTVIGPNGAGKTTFLDLITGRTKPDEGTLLWDNAEHNLLKKSEYEIYRLGIGRKFQTPTVYNDHSVEENLVLSLAGSRGIWNSLFGRIDSEQRDRMAWVLDTIRLTKHAKRKAGTLAHGQKQWLEIGMLLAQEARLLLVDEPAAGMTDEETHHTGELLLSLAGKHTIVVIEHDMTFVRQISQDRKVTVLHQGSVLCEGSIDHVQSDERVMEVYLGRKSKAA
jgi:urea transport system ATP-binding protein